MHLENGRMKIVSFDDGGSGEPATFGRTSSKPGGGSCPNNPMRLGCIKYTARPTATATVSPKAQVYESNISFFSHREVDRVDPKVPASCFSLSAE